MISVDGHTSTFSYTLNSPPGTSTRIEIPPAQYSLADLTDFTFFEVGTCQNSQNFPPGTLCDYLSLSFFNNPDKPALFLAVEFDPKSGGQAGSGASYSPVPNQPSIHGGLLTMQLVETSVPEPSSFACFAAAAGLIFALQRKYLRFVRSG